MKMDALWKKEEYRWSYMSDDELLERLRRIRNVDKAENFIAMARRSGKRSLEEAGTRHLTWLRKAKSDPMYKPPVYQERKQEQRPAVVKKQPVVVEKKRERPVVLPPLKGSVVGRDFLL